MTKSDFIFMLVRSALWKQPLEHFDMTPWEYKAVMEDADKQCVTGLITDCLRTNNMGLKKKCVIHMLKLQKVLVAENQRINDNLKALLELLGKKGIIPTIVKGQSIGSLYPTPNLRVPGDIDFYVLPKEFEATLQALEQEWLEENPVREDIDKEFAFSHNGTTMELHRHLLMFANKKLMNYFSRLAETCERVSLNVDGIEIKTLEPTVNIFYTFCHLYHHFRMEGVAVRQLCDMAILLHANKDAIDRKRLEDILRETGYTNAFKAFGSIIIRKIGLPEDEYPINITEKDHQKGNKILKEILRSGNWGLYGRKTHEENLMHTLETGKIEIMNNLRFFSLSPRENLSQLTRDVPSRVKTLFKRKLKGK